MLILIAALFVSAISLVVATLNGLTELDSRRPVVVKRQAAPDEDNPKPPLTKQGKPIEIDPIGH